MDQLKVTDQAGHTLFIEPNIVAAMAAAGINITGISTHDGEYTFRGKTVKYCYTAILYEFQWKSRGNYIWSKTLHGGTERVEAQLCDIIDTVIDVRKILEDPNDQGNYRYLFNLIKR